LVLFLSSPGDYENISSEQLGEILEKFTLKKFAEKKIHSVSDIAKNSFGIKFCADSFSFQLKLLIEQINFIENQVKDVEKQISALLKKINSPITSIPGIGDVLVLQYLVK